MAARAARVEVTGDKELRRALKRMDGSLGDLREVHRDAGQEVLTRANTLVPRKTGRLARSQRLSIRLAGGKSAGTRIIAGRGVSVPYAGPIHFGWRARNIEPQPWLYDALDDRREQVRKRYDEGVAHLVRRLDRETPG